MKNYIGKITSDDVLTCLKKMQKSEMQANGEREASWKDLVEFISSIGKIIDRIEFCTGMNERTGRIAGCLQIVTPLSTSPLYLNRACSS